MIEMGKKYRTRDGRDVRILCTDGPGGFPVVGFIQGDNEPEVWDKNGDSCWSINIYLIEVNPYQDYKLDEKVYVSMDGEFWDKRHYAGLDSEGKPTVWNDGGTSWTKPSQERLSWNFCKRQEDC